MPGYSQLKKLSEDVLQLGDEPRLRAERGEKVLPVTIPDTVQDIDDSDDFVMGMPDPDETALPADDEPAIDTDAILSEMAAAGRDEAGSSIPDVDSLLGDFSDSGDIDLSAFESAEPAATAAPESVADMSLDDLLRPHNQEAVSDGISGTSYKGFGRNSAEENVPVPEPATDSPDINSIPAEMQAEADGIDLPAADDTPAGIPDEPAPLADNEVGELEAFEQDEVSPAVENGAAVSDSFSIDELPDLSDDMFTVEEQMPVAGEPSFLETEPVQKNIPENTYDLSDLPDGRNGLLPPDMTFDEIENFRYEAPVVEAAPEKAQVSRTEDGADEPQKQKSVSNPDVFDPDSIINGLEEVDDIPAAREDAIPMTEMNDDGSFSGTSAAVNAPVEEEDSFNLDDIPEMEFSDVPAAADVPENSAENLAEEITDPDFAYSGAPIDLNLDLPEEYSEVPPEVSGKLNDIDGTIEPEPAEDIPEMGDIPEMNDIPENGSAADDIFNISPDDDPYAGADMSSMFNTDGPDGESFEMTVPEDDGAGPADDSFSEPAASDDFKMDDITGMDFGGDSGDNDIFNISPEDDPSGSAASGDFNMNDIAGMNLDGGSGDDMFNISPEDDPFNGATVPLPDSDMDLAGFDDPHPAAEPPADSDASDSGSIEDFTVPDTDTKLAGGNDDFELDAGGSGDMDFEIPGFSDADADPFGKNGKINLPTPDFSGGLAGDGKPKNTLTEKEYDQFKKNLAGYPLNVRIAVEDMIAKNEFTDDVVFEVIEKILKKVTARQLANHLEKMLDVSIAVPRDFERRSAAEYEAYKQSFQYQLKNRILPTVFMGLLALILLSCIGYLSNLFIIRPVQAENLYKQGYTLLENDEYPQSEIKFNEALEKKAKKKWFFTYARGYREHKQYDRAEKMYKNILWRYDHDKQAGLEYVRMEMEDLANYEYAEQLMKREVLDYHVNDPDAILLLGDVYLEWATEKDPEKYAFEQYSALINLYGQNDLYLARMLRYNIRTDKLRDVLQLKETFYPREKSLSAEDWTEFSGYLMDKLYGNLPAQQEYLREKIEDVHDMLSIAIKADPSNPVACYNLARYFVESGSHMKSQSALKDTVRLFDATKEIKRRDVYKQLDAYRLLGESYVYDKEYILAQETFSKGLDLFERKKHSGGFEGDANVGKMYADLGDIDYFISGDYDNALRSYYSSVENKNDTPSIRYRLGYLNYGRHNFDEALSNFIKTQSKKDNDLHLLLAMGNTLSLKNDNYAAQGYYQRLLNYLDVQRAKYGIVLPQIDEDASDIVDVYMKSSNNLGVSLYRLARQTGDSSLNASSIVRFQDAIRYWDALTRNQTTMVRLPGSNLAEQNLQYAIHPVPEYEPAIYTDIPRILYGEKGLEQ